ncbi:MAG: DUF4912 domain-containing protein [Spirochaetota bacterium]|nr:DUF4912 domain-containing protein [Spirochaetota bacterium]
MGQVKNVDELMKMTKAELIEFGKSHNIKGLQSLKKADIIEKLISEGKSLSSKLKAKPQKQEKEIASKKSVTKPEVKATHPTTNFEEKKYEVIDVKTFKEPENNENDVYIPHNYNETKIVAMVRDPEWVFSYWEINHNLWQDLDLDNKQLVLRVYDVTAVNFNGLNANSFYDIRIDHVSQNWYINVPLSERDYCIDLGYYGAEGRFYTIARSNIISVPRNGMSNVYDEEWMTVEELFKLSGGYKQISGSFEIGQMLAERLKMAISSESLVSSWALPSSENLPSSLSRA